MVEAISAARAHGDLSENFEYHAAKNEQGLLERRIVILRDRFDHAEVVEDGTADIVSEGSHVVVVDESGARVDVEMSALGGPGTVSPSSPLGSVILGKRIGDTVDVQAPSGPWRATIVEMAWPWLRHQPASARPMVPRPGQAHRRPHEEGGHRGTCQKAAGRALEVRDRGRRHRGRRDEARRLTVRTCPIQQSTRA